MPGHPVPVVEWVDDPEPTPEEAARDRPAPNGNGTARDDEEAQMGRIAGARLSWASGASRLSLRSQLEQLQSFDPGDRTRAGVELVHLGLARSVYALLDHVRGEVDDRVLASIARAVRAEPVQGAESGPITRLRDWARIELERLAVEDAFIGEETAVAPPQAVATREPSLDRYIRWQPPGDVSAV